MHYILMWDTPWIPTWTKYRVSRVSEYIYIYMYVCICVCVYIYYLNCFKINVTFGWWCLLYTANLNQPLNQLKFINASYDTYCEKYLLKSKFMKLSNFAWFIDLFMTSFNQRYSLRYHSYIVLFAYFSTFDGYCLIIQIINQIPFIYFAIYARFSVNMVNPYGGQYIVLSSIKNASVQSLC